MKKIISIIALGVALMAGFSCQQLTDLETKVDQNTSDIAALKTQVAALQDIVNKGYVITETKEITGGYEFTLSNGKKITVTNGKDGKDGKDGVDGKDGKDGKDGADGKDGKDGDSFFGSVTVDQEAGIVKIVLKDGTTFNVPLAVKKGFVAQVNQLFVIPEYDDYSVTFDYVDETTYNKIKIYFGVLPFSASELIKENMDSVGFMVGAYELKTRTPSGINLDNKVSYDSENETFVMEVDPKNFIDEYGLDSNFCLTIILTDDDNQVLSNPIPVYKNCNVLVYEGEKYRTTRLADGKTWMAENLRYLPQGVEPSLDPSDVSLGIWYPVNLSTKALTADPEVIKAQGYLYTASVAFRDNITAENYYKFEGCRGICPEGWHIPTGAEIFKITGRLPGWPGSKTATTPGDKSSESPYNNSTVETLGNCMMELLNADGFNSACTGCISYAPATSKLSSNIAMGYYLGSTAYSWKEVSEKVPVAHAMYNVMMPVKANGTCNGAQAANLSGFAVRCVKD